MSLEDYQGSVWAWRELMKAAQRDIDEGGEIKKARPLSDERKTTKRAA